MFDKIFQIIEITLPVFLLIILGKILILKKFISEDQKNFITKLTYKIALPILVFSAISKENISELLQPALFTATFGTVLITALIFFILSKFLNLSGNLAAAFIFSSYWANTAYVGFPIALNAFGEKGLSQAAIINAFCVPLYIPLSLLIVNIMRKDDNNTPKISTKQILNNPIIIAILIGIGVSIIRTLIPTELLNYKLTLNLEKTVYSTLTLIGSMGLPLALIAVGASLNIKTIKSVPHLLTIVFIGKMIIVPTIAFLIIKYLFPESSQITTGIAIIVLGTPQAVVSYIIAKEEGIAEDFVSASLAFTTMGSIITIPLWLYYIL